MEFIDRTFGGSVWMPFSCFGVQDRGTFWSPLLELVDLELNKQNKNLWKRC